MDTKKRTERPIYRSTSRRPVIGPWSAMGICVAAVMLLLPFTQWITDRGPGNVELRTVDITLPPPPPPPPEPPPPEDTQDEPPAPDMQTPPPNLSLSQMDMALNPGIGDAAAGAFSFEGFGVTDAASDLDIFQVSDLDRPPRRTRTVAPTYPQHLRAARVQGFVTLQVLIDQNGRVTVQDVVESSHRDFVAAAIDAAERCQFEPPQRGGETVRAIYNFTIRFNL